ncbi:MAG TPA: UDP-glucuronic acid decarboxylase family protein [Candidatus Paceibacterota bacterium]|nr:UDP-glucuronic acid decarboxylase family protein [Candidatus Paceibacterota bacterium]
MKILITGGAGFIGTNLAERLLAAGHEVWALDNFFSGPRANVERFAGDPRFHAVEHDVTERFDLGEKFDRIYNLACPASPPWYQKDPVKTMRTNVEGSVNVLDFARRCGARVLQASTSEVYGDPLEHPQKESYRGNVTMLGPRACYDEGKRAAETVFMEYHRMHGVDVRIVRIFNTYGPYMSPDDGRVVSNFIIQALKGEPITIYGDGSQTRSFQYVSDLLDGMTAMMESTGFVGPVNIGNPGEFTVREFAQKVIALTGSKSAIEQRPLPTDDPRQRKPDISLAKEKLGWEPKVSLEEGLRKTIAYFASILNKERV